MIRPIELDDLPWVLTLGWRRYKGKDGDPGGGLRAFFQAMGSPKALAIRSEHGFLVGNSVVVGWLPDKRDFHILAVCVEEGHHWDAVALLRYSINWAQLEGCTRWLFSGDTEHPIAGLAKRVGASAVPYYSIELTGGT